MIRLLTTVFENKNGSSISAAVIKYNTSKETKKTVKINYT